MASMVAKSCSCISSQMSSITVQEKSRNKRKYRADPPLADPGKVITLPSNECLSFEFSAEKCDGRGNLSNCNMCSVNKNSAVGTSKTGSNRPRGEIESSSEDFNDAGWSELAESELGELVLRNLDIVFKTAIKKIVACGYSVEVVSKAILRYGLWYGRKDIVPNIVENTLSCLRSGQEIDPLKEHFEDLQQMEKYILADLVYFLREVRPMFSSGDAMWCLLICDMNVSHACNMELDPSGGFAANSTSKLIPSEQKSHIPIAPNSPLNLPSFQSEAPKLANTPYNFNLENSIDPDSVKEKPFSSSGVSQTTITGERFVGSSKVSANSEMESTQKQVHSERHYRKYGSKSSSRTSKLSSFSGLVMDKKLKGAADSMGLNTKNAPFKINNKADGFDIRKENVKNLSTPSFGLETVNQSSSLWPKSTSLPVADTELSLSFPAKNIAIPNLMPISYNSDASANCGSLLSHQWGTQDGKDEEVTELVSRVRGLQNELNRWTEWTNCRVMQAARRLGKDKSELKALRQEKDEVEKLKKEKQTLEENTMKKLSEMENALYKASGQVERAGGAVRRLEVENSILRREMEAAKLRATESAASYQEVSKREKKTLMKFQSWEKQKIVFQEELSAEKSKFLLTQQKLQQAKDVKYQAETKLSEEEKAKNELLAQASSYKKEREQIEVSTQSKEDTIKSRAETNLKKYKEDIARLEKEISQLRLKTDSSKIAALKQGIDGSYAGMVTDFMDSAKPYISKTTMTAGNGGVKRDRECVMCLSEEMSVIFLPCAHQVVCVMCNELHEKQGMKDCPSCRTLIQRRLCVRYAHT